MCLGRRPPSGAGPPGLRPPRHVPDCSGRSERLSETWESPGASERASERPTLFSGTGRQQAARPHPRPVRPERRLTARSSPLEGGPGNRRGPPPPLAGKDVSQGSAPALRGDRPEAPPTGWSARGPDWLPGTKTGGAAVNHARGVRGAPTRLGGALRSQGRDEGRGATPAGAGRTCWSGGAEADRPVPERSDAGSRFRPERAAGGSTGGGGGKAAAVAMALPGAPAPAPAAAPVPPPPPTVLMAVRAGLAQPSRLPPLPAAAALRLQLSVEPAAGGQRRFRLGLRHPEAAGGAVRPGAGEATRGWVGEVGGSEVPLLGRGAIILPPPPSRSRYRRAGGGLCPPPVVGGGPSGAATAGYSLPGQRCRAWRLGPTARSGSLRGGGGARRGCAHPHRPSIGPCRGLGGLPVPARGLPAPAPPATKTPPVSDPPVPAAGAVGQQEAGAGGGVQVPAVVPAGVCPTRAPQIPPVRREPRLVLEKSGGALGKA